jgi:transcriptional regulator with XRE-family HTH domain
MGFRYRPTVLQDARLIKGLTQTELARKTKLSVSAVNTIERGRGPWIMALRAIAKHLDVDLADVIIPGNGKQKSAS